VLLPERNKKDFENVPEAAREAVRFVWLSTPPRKAEQLPGCGQSPGKWDDSATARPTLGTSSSMPSGL
jgi:hypothetical protein